MRKLILAIIYFCAIGLLSAKAQNQYFQKGLSVNLGLAASESQFVPSIYVYKLHGLGQNKKFSLGYGLRFTSSFSTAKDYITAPAKLTSKMQGPQVLFSKTYEENLDTLTVGDGRFYALNATIHLNYSFSSKMAIEFNIDAIGFSFGPSRTATFQSNAEPATNGVYQAKPTKANVLLVSDNDIGTLNSELLVSYQISPKWGLKAGACFIFTELTANQKLAFDNDRFRNKALLPELVVSYRISP